MTATTDHIVPSQTGMRRMISPWAWHHLRASATIRFAAATFTLVVAGILFSVGYAALAAVPLAGTLVNVAWGYWELSIARSAAPRT